MSVNFIDIVFDGAPGPVAPRFVEVEDASGKSINLGTWIHQSDGYWVIRIQDMSDNDPERLRAQLALLSNELTGQKEAYDDLRKQSRQTRAIMDLVLKAVKAGDGQSAVTILELVLK